MCQTSGTSLPSTPQEGKNGNWCYDLIREDKCSLAQGPNEYSLGYNNPISTISTPAFSNVRNQVYRIYNINRLVILIILHII